MLPFLTTLVITTVIWKEIRDGHLTRLPLAPGSFAERLPDTRLRRATVVGLLCLLVFGPISLALLLLFDYGDISTGEFVLFKAIFGIVLGALVTPFIAMVAFGDEPPPAEAGSARRRRRWRRGSATLCGSRRARSTCAASTLARRLGSKGDKAAARKAQEKLAPRLGDLQEQLFAEGRTGGRRRMLLVLQGLDTSGKGGTVRHVVGQMDPQGVHDRGVRAAHPRGAPPRLPVAHPAAAAAARASSASSTAPTTRTWSPCGSESWRRAATWSRRFAAINRFEEGLVADDTRIVKCFLHISRDEFCRRQRARLDDPTKHWKFSPADLEDLGLWNDYLDAYGDALERCNTEQAPWYVVPADRKWYRNWAITTLLIEQLEEMDLRWPPATFDVEEQRSAARAAC